MRQNLLFRAEGKGVLYLMPMRLARWIYLFDLLKLPRRASFSACWNRIRIRSRAILLSRPFLLLFAMVS